MYDCSTVDMVVRVIYGVSIVGGILGAIWSAWKRDHKAVHKCRLVAVFGVIVLVIYELARALSGVCI